MTAVTSRFVKAGARHPVRMLAIWLALMCAVFAVGNAVGMTKALNADYGTGEAGAAEDALVASGLDLRATEYVLVEGDDQAATASVAAAVRESLDGVDYVASLSEPMVSETTTSAAVAIEIEGDLLQASQRLTAIGEAVADVQADHPELSVELVGRASRSAGLDQQRSVDLLKTESITIPVAVVILVVALGSVTQALIPVIVGAVTVIGGLGLSLLGSRITPDVGVGANVVVLLGLAIAIDYALFFILERRHSDDDPEARLERATMAATTVLRAGAAILAAAACLYLAQDVVLSSLATNTIAVVISAVLSSLLGLPALLTLQERLMAWRGRPAYRRRRRRPGRAEAALPLAVRSPKRVLAATLLGLAILSAPVVGMKLDTPGSSTYSQSIPAVASFVRLAESFPSVGTSHTVVVTGSTDLDVEYREGIARDAVLATASRYGVAPSWVTVATSEDGAVTRVSLGQDAATDAQAAEDLASALRAEAAPSIVAGLPGTTVLTMGDAEQNGDKLDAIIAEAPVVLVALLIAITLVTAISFRSIGVAVAGSFMTAATAVATLGIVVFMAQGMLYPLVESMTPPYVAQRVPILLVVMLFGITVDYQFFVLSAIDARREGLQLQEAISVGLRESRAVIMSAATVMTVIFLSFLGLQLVEMRQIGFALAVSVVLDAFVVRTLLLPSCLMLGGERVWPRRRVEAH